MTREGYPKDFQEFIAQFKTDEYYRQYLFEMRWPNGFSCPKYESVKYWMNNRDLPHCSECGHQTSIISGTIFQGSRKPLLIWFHIIWWVSAQKTGASANNLRDFYGVWKL